MFDDAYICNRIQELDIDYKNLYADFQSKKPSETQYTDFYNHPLFSEETCSWWSDKNEDTAKSNKQRVLFLKQIISEL